MKLKGFYIPGLLAGLVALGSVRPLEAAAIFFNGNLRTDATALDCGPGCVLGPANTDADFAQWAAVAKTFTVATGGPMQAITYGFGGGTSQTGAVVSAGGLEPYLSLFDSAGNFLASTYFGTTCPVGANSVGGLCYDVLLDGGVLAPGTYQIALTAYGNMSIAENWGVPELLSSGFGGLGQLAEGENLNYAFDLILPGNVGPPTAAVPEPGTCFLMLVPYAALVLRRWSKSR